MIGTANRDSKFRLHLASEPVQRSPFHSCLCSGAEDARRCTVRSDAKTQECRSQLLVFPDNGNNGKNSPSAVYLELQSYLKASSVEMLRYLHTILVCMYLQSLMQ